MSVMDSVEILDYVETWSAGSWSEPPMSWSGLAKTFRASVHHDSAVYFKRNVYRRRSWGSCRAILMGLVRRTRQPRGIRAQRNRIVAKAIRAVQ